MPLLMRQTSSIDDDFFNLELLDSCPIAQVGHKPRRFRDFEIDLW